MISDCLRILVVEDDFFAAHKLSEEIRAGGDKVVGPFADVHDAIHRVGLVQAAILDVRVQDESSFHVADSLVHHGIPFVFLTGFDPQAVPARFERRHVYTKPSHAAPLLHDLHAQHRAMAAPDTSSIELVVVEMMRRSRVVMPDETSADRLVEAALMQAIAETTQGPPVADMGARLLDLLEDEYRQRGRLYLQ